MAKDDNPKVGLILGGLDEAPDVDGADEAEGDDMDEALEATVQAIADGDLEQAKDALRAAITQALLNQ